LPERHLPEKHLPERHLLVLPEWTLARLARMDTLGIGKALKVRRLGVGANAPAAGGKHRLEIFQFFYKNNAFYKYI